MREAWNLHKYVIYEIEHEKYQYRWQAWAPSPTSREEVHIWKGWAWIAKDEILMLSRPEPRTLEKISWDEHTKWRESLRDWKKTLYYAEEKNGADYRRVDTNELVAERDLVGYIRDIIDQASNERNKDAKL